MFLGGAIGAITGGWLADIKAAKLLTQGEVEFDYEN